MSCIWWIGWALSDSSVSLLRWFVHCFPHWWCVSCWYSMNGDDVNVLHPSTHWIVIALDELFVTSKLFSVALSFSRFVNAVKDEDESEYMSWVPSLDVSQFPAGRDGWVRQHLPYIFFDYFWGFPHVCHHVRCCESREHLDNAEPHLCFYVSEFPECSLFS